ncbi:50S ribosomal protein 5, chloroplastic-like protein [Corchorus capsularis]|uniref:50S ribosomal protein 5, chloroplastic-like protein n=1 Tax=Corchorus capsularis TaxID=210143 RepID=A0A1R3HRS5_COCAP|nr:50S ribosomal protein 5, chloroplastic-like protein [Corchorus capsularis]
MALLSFNPLPSLLSSPISSCSTSLPLAISPISWLRLKAIDNSRSKCLIGTRFIPNKKKSLVMTVKATASGEGEAQPPSEALPVEQLPLESDTKKQQLTEQRLRMKLAKKIRLRRKRLVRKRKMRKKGRWPPSKMKKLKNV